MVHLVDQQQVPLYPISDERQTGASGRDARAYLGRSRSPTKHTLAIAVAVLYVALSLPDGGFPAEAIAAGTLLVWWAVIVGLAVGGWPRGAIPRAAVGAGLCIVGLAIFTALSLAWTSDDGRGFVEAVRVAGYAGVFVLVLLTSRAGSGREWLHGLALGIVAVAVIALTTRFVPELPGGDSRIGDFIPTARGRLSFPIGYWNGLAACLAFGTVLVTWAGAQAQTKLARSLGTAALATLVLAIYLTSSRGGMIAAGIGLAVLVALGPARARLFGSLALGGAGGGALIAVAQLRAPLVDDPESIPGQNAGAELLLATIVVVAAVALARHLADGALSRLTLPRPSARVAIPILAVLAVGAVVAADPATRIDQFKQPPPAETFGDATVSGHLASGTSSGRYQFWSAALDAFSSQPLYGIGAGSFEWWWNQHGSIPRSIRDAHSLLFEVTAELGIVGLLLVVSFVAFGVVHGWRRRRGGSPNGVVEAALAVLAVGVFSASIDWTWEVPAAFVPVVVAVALLVGPATITARAGPRSAEGSQRSFGWGVATLLPGWLAVWIAGVLFLTEVKLDSSRDAVDRGDLPTAAQDAADAATLQPWAAEPRVQLALVQEEAGNLGAARRELADAIERAPEDWSLWYVSSRIEEAAGDPEAATTAFERARELNPRAPIFAEGEAAAPRAADEDEDEGANGALPGP